MKAILLTLSLIGAVAYADCFPKNTLWIGVNSVLSKGISEKAFNQDLDMVEKYYAPLVEKRGAKLKINRLWADGTVNSDASQPGNGFYVINSYGGLARYPIMTKDAYLQVACHEMGHHLGGAPKYFGDDWASNEGQADYFSSLACMKALGVSSKRIKASSLVLAKVLAELGGEPMPDPKKKDQSVVNQTNDDHPMAQCRLDTYLAGEACDKKGELSETDPSVNTCYPDGVGARPFCWFKP